MIKNRVAESKKYFENAEVFAAWAAEKENLELTAEEAKLILGYVEGHGYQVCLNENGTLVCEDVEEPENESAARCIEELIDRVCHWNYEFLLDDTVAGDWRESINRDAVVIGEIHERMGSRDGYCIGTPTVKELIAILSKLPEDYRVTCCGGKNYLYRFEEGKYITIDCERYLS
jgi:hypothetical protein